MCEHIKSVFGEQQLNILRICLKSITFLARNSNMSGISAQQYIRQREGVVVVRQEVGEKIEVQVTKNGEVLKTFPGDALGTASLFIFSAIWHMYARHERLLYDYVFAPAYSFVSGFNIDKVLQGFERVAFEEQVLPELEKANDPYPTYAGKYREAITIPGRAGDYAVYDVLVRMFSYIRSHNFNLDYINWSRLHPVPVRQALGNLTAYNSFLLSGKDDVYLGLLKEVFPAGGEFDYGGNHIYVADKTCDVLSIIGGVGFDVELNNLKFDGISSKDAPKLQSAPRGIVRAVKTVIDQELMGELAALVEVMLEKSETAWDESEKALRDYPRDNNLIGPKGVGKNALKGLTMLVLGLPIPQAIQRVAEHLRAKTAISVEAAAKIAASRIAQMRSAIVLDHTSGQPVVKSRGE